jgi:hypothetical protein
MWWRAALCALLLTSASSPAAAVEGISTHVEVELRFGTGCSGSGWVAIADGNGNRTISYLWPQAGETVHRTPVTWRPGVRIHIETKFGGNAGPVLRLIAVGGHELLRVPLHGAFSDHVDTFAINCSGGEYAAMPDTSTKWLMVTPLSWIGIVLVLLAGAWLVVHRLLERPGATTARA